MRPADFVSVHDELEGLPEGSRSCKHLAGMSPDDEERTYDADTAISARRPKHSSRNSTLCVLSSRMFQPRQ